MTSHILKPKKKNPLKRSRVPVSPPGMRSRAATAMATYAAEGRLALQHCLQCGAVQYPARELCRACLSSDLEWRDTNPTGEIIAQTTIRATPDAHFRQHLPVRIGTVRLECGVSLIARLHRRAFRGEDVRVLARIDAAGQAILIAAPDEEEEIMQDDETVRALCCDPRHRRILIADARAPEAAALSRALLDAGAAHVFAGLPEAWKPFEGHDRFGGPDQCSFMKLDVTDEQSVRDLAASIGGKVDILIANARHTRPGDPMTRQDTITARLEFETGVLGMLRLAQVFGPAMRARGEDGVNSACAFVNILPIGALVPQQGYGVGAAAAAATLALSHALRAEMRGTGVRVVNIYAGPMDDEWHQELPPPKLTAKALAAAVTRALIEGREEMPAGEIAKDIYQRWRADPALAIREANGGTMP